ncbi:unnamed protein product, partial [Mesorhabditis belari]|uniref:EGF-like domain-containing protein n=1 Tax=Mesorhabditis belari TaxID=2138241 RepID=A0AAF3FS42_9BILA
MNFYFLLFSFLFFQHSSGFQWKVLPNQLLFTDDHCHPLLQHLISKEQREIRELTSFQVLHNDALALLTPPFGERPLAVNCTNGTHFDIRKGKIVVLKCNRSFCSERGECVTVNEGTYSQMYECFCDSWYYGKTCEEKYPNDWWITAIGWFLWIFLLIALPCSAIFKPRKDKE